MVRIDQSTCCSKVLDIQDTFPGLRSQFINPGGIEFFRFRRVSISSFSLVYGKNIDILDLRPVIVLTHQSGHGSFMSDHILVRIILESVSVYQQIFTAIVKKETVSASRGYRSRGLDISLFLGIGRIYFIHGVSHRDLFRNLGHGNLH